MTGGMTKKSGLMATENFLGKLVSRFFSRACTGGQISGAVAVKYAGLATNAVPTEKSRHILNINFSSNVSKCGKISNENIDAKVLDNHVLKEGQWDPNPPTWKPKK